MTADNSTRKTEPAQAQSPTSARTVARPYYQSAPYQAAMMRAGILRGAQILFQELVRRSGRRGYTWALQGDLADYFGVTARTIRRWEASLASAGILTLGRVSFWARQRKGGVRRVAIPHLYDGTSFKCPSGVLDEAKHLLCDGRKVKAEAVKNRRSMRRGVTPYGAGVTVYKSPKEKEGPVETTGDQTHTENQTPPEPAPKLNAQGQPMRPEDIRKPWPETYSTREKFRESLNGMLRSATQWVRDQGVDRMETWGWTVAEVCGPGWKRDGLDLGAVGDASGRMVSA